MPDKKVIVSASLGEKFRIEGRIGSHSLIVDQPPAAGGEDAGPTPLDYLLLSLAGCQATIARIVAIQKRIELRAFDVTVEGALNTDVLLGKSQDDRCGFRSFTVKVRIDADLSREDKEAFLHEVDRRCPVSENLLNATPVTIELVE